jgi:hypothetical protein
VIGRRERFHFLNGSQRHLKRQAPLLGGLAFIREAISDGDIKAKKHGRRTIILPNDLTVWLSALPDAARGQSADAQ